jgi:hypothetical protein
MSINSYKAKLVLSIIEEHFGSITKDVAIAVITTENSNLFQIAKKCSELPKASKINSKQVSVRVGFSVRVRFSVSISIIIAVYFEILIIIIIIVIIILTQILILTLV